LDQKLVGINRLIHAKLSAIEQLGALKSALVKKCALRGTTNKNVLSDTGVEWFGCIPCHWNLVPIKRLFTIVSGATPKSGIEEYWNGDITWVTPADYKTADKYIVASERYLSDEGYNSCSTHLVPIGSIVITKRAPVGTVAISNIELCTSQGCLSCIPNNGVNTLYYYYLFSVMSDVFEAHASGTTFKEISAAAFGALKVPFPDAYEQKEIVDLLENRCSVYDETIRLHQRQIQSLNSLRTRLISDAITGRAC